MSSSGSQVTLENEPDRVRHRWSAALVLALLSLLYTALTLFYTWPLALHLDDRLANDAGDPALVAWFLWWNSTTLPLSETWWNGLGFWPTSGTMGFSEHLLGFAWLTSPIMWLGGSPALAYNVAFLSSFALSAWATHLLVWRLTDRHDAGLVAGVAFGFATIRAGHLAHLQVLMTAWMPLALLGLHEFWRTRRPRWLALFAVGWLLQALTNNYYALFFSVLVTLWLAWFGLRRQTRGRFLAAAGASILAAAMLLPVVSGYTRVREEHGLQRGIDEAAIFSADLAAFVNAPQGLWLWGWLRTEDRGERELFGGVTALVLLGVLAWRRGWFAKSWAPAAAEAPPRWRRLTRRTLAIVGVVIIAFGIAIAIDGRDRHLVAGIEISTRHPDKPLMVGVLLLAVAAALSTRARRLIAGREPLAFYVIAWAVCLVLSTGPELRLFDTRLLYRTPYGLLFEFVPGFDGVRAPARFAMVATLCLSVAAGLAFAQLTRRGRRSAQIAALVSALAFVAEGSVRSLPLAPLPAPAPPIANGDDIILELPITDAFGEAAALYRSTGHGRRMVNGYSGHEPLFHRALRDGLDLDDVSALVELTTLTPITVLIEPHRDPDGRWRRLAEAAGARVASTTPSFVVLHADRRGPVTPPPPIAGSPLAIAAVETNVYPDFARAAVDGSSNTAWGTDEAQKAGDWLTVDLGRVAAISGVEIDQGRWTADVPRRLEVAVSEHGQDWRPVWSGATAVQTMRAALIDPRRVRLALPCGGNIGRYVRVRQTASGGTTPWTVAEVRVLGAPASAAALTAP
jgi:hypothetical protein